MLLQVILGISLTVLATSFASAAPRMIGWTQDGWPYDDDLIYPSVSAAGNAAANRRNQDLAPHQDVFRVTNISYYLNSGTTKASVSIESPSNEFVGFVGVGLGYRPVYADIDVCCGNPIEIGSGNKIQTEYDWVSPRINFLRFFNEQFLLSQDSRPGQPLSVNKLPPLGNTFWYTNYHRKLNFLGDSVMTLASPQGKLTQLYAISATEWRSDLGPDERLIQLGDSSYQFFSKDGTQEFYSPYGDLLKVIKANGLIETYEYDPIIQRLAKVVTSQGDVVSFTYHMYSNFLKEVILPDNQIISYEYDNQARLSRVIYPDSKSRTYLYEKHWGQSKLSGIVDELGFQYAKFTYDSNGKAVSTMHLLSDMQPIENYEVLPWTHIGQPVITVKEPSGAVTNYKLEPYSTTLMGSGASWPYRVGEAERTCPGCATIKTRQHIDSNTGLTEAYTDGNGTLTRYTYDTVRRLETSKTLAKDTPQEKTITTVWHPTFRLPTKITEPGRITEYTYDTRANVTLKKVTDTTLATPVVRSTTYTYVYNADANNPYIQKLTVDGPRTDVNDITVYNYDTKGNLSTVTQQTSANTTLITNYGGYDANGRVGTITAPNGVVTQLTYHPRGWLKTRVIGFGSATPLTTTFEYDPVGQLIKVTLPDSSTVSYTYDAAHRLTDIVDASGNRIHYTLDNAGNRIKEEVTDATGVLAALLVQIQTAQADAQLPHAGEAI